MSRTILTSSDRGIHTCKVKDDDGNARFNITEMKLIGKIFSNI